MQPGVTWIRVEKPVFDLVGVVLSSFKLAGLLLLAAFAVGALAGLVLILRRRAHPPASPLEAASLRLNE